MQFFGLLSRLWACNPSQSLCHPPNPGPIHHNQDCEGFRNHSQSKWFSHNQRGLQADCVHCCNTNYQCRARHCCNRRGNVCVQTWYQPLRSMYNQNSKKWMLSYFAIRSQSNFYSFQSMQIVPGLQDFRWHTGPWWLHGLVVVWCTTLEWSMH